jgi:uncharacterized protein
MTTTCDACDRAPAGPLAKGRERAICAFSARLQPMRKPPTTDAALLDDILDRLVRELKPDQVYLFGSRARGDADPDSDFDLLIVVTESSLPGYARDRLALRALRGIRVPVDTIVLTREEFDRKREVVSSLPATVEREGKLLYAA